MAVKGSGNSWQLHFDTICVAPVHSVHGHAGVVCRAECVGCCEGHSLLVLPCLCYCAAAATAVTSPGPLRDDVHQLHAVQVCSIYGGLVRKASSRAAVAATHVVAPEENEHGRRRFVMVMHVLTWTLERDGAQPQHGQLRTIVMLRLWRVTRQYGTSSVL